MTQRRLIQFRYLNFKGQPTKAQAVIEGDNASLNRLFMLLCDHPRIDEVTQHEIATGDELAGPRYHQGASDEG